MQRLTGRLLRPAFTPLWGQIGKFQSKPIRAIRFAPEAAGLVPVELAEKLKPLAIGQPLQMRHVRQAIEQLFATGSFNDIDVEAELEGDGVALTFRTRAASFIRNVTVEGVEDPPGKGLLVNATKLQLGQPYSPLEVRQSVESLMDVLRTNGFYLAKVAPETFPQPAQQIDINFSVDTGKRAKFTLPVIKGSPNKSIDQVMRAARWKRAYGLLGWKEVTDTRTQQGLDRIRRSYQKKDFLMARVTLDQMDYDAAQNLVTPVISIDSGPKVKVQTKGAKISKGTLRELVPVYQELTVDKDLLVEGTRARSVYAGARIFEAQVDFDLTEGKDKETVVEYTSSLAIVSLSSSASKAIATCHRNPARASLYLPRQLPALPLRPIQPGASPARRSRDQVPISDQRFRDVSVKSRVEDDYQGKLHEVAVFFEVTEGPQSFVSDLIFDGVAVDIEEELRTMVQSLEQQPYSELNVATDQDTILNYFYNKGYPNATFEASAKPETGSQLVSLKYAIRPGERQFVRDVLISGLSTTSRDLVSQRIRNLAPGDPLSQVSMIESQRRLYDL
ncbi:MAG: POTRA domain-containing protein, partial [Bryobacteraceae bacterium]